MAEIVKRICIVTLIGLPGSGKTYLSTFLVEHLKSLNYSVICVSYDDYIHSINDTSYKWKEKRKEIYYRVNDLITTLKRQTNIDNTLMPDVNNGTLNSEIVIIIDDNMYYRSMRYEYFKLAKKYEISFCQIYLKATLHQALDSNNKRDNSMHVADTTIVKMDKLIEVPDLKNHWEKFTLVLQCFVKLDEMEGVKDIEGMIKASMNSPEKSNVNENVVPTQKMVDTNLVHKVDISLRSTIGENIKKLNMCKEQVKDVAEILNKRRKDMLEKLKSGNITLPANILYALLDGNDADSKTLVHNYLQNLLFDK